MVTFSRLGADCKVGIRIIRVTRERDLEYREMDKWIYLLFFFSGLAPLTLSQYDHTSREYQRGNPPPASILLHKQALGQDGSFNYAFAADNGLQQGEVINPDGSRRGSYSYVDPNGKTVSLSYTAGKDGFRVLDGDHVPKNPEAQRQRPNFDHRSQLTFPRPRPDHYYASHPGNPVPYEYYRNAVNSPAYRGRPAPHEEAYRSEGRPPVGIYPPAPPAHPAPQQELHYYEAPHRRPQPSPQYHPRQYSVQEGNYEKPAPLLIPQHQPSYRQQEPQKPHSFGNGFAFEFGGK